MIYLHLQLNYNTGTCGPILLTISNAYTYCVYRSLYYRPMHKAK